MAVHLNDLSPKARAQARAQLGQQPPTDLQKRLARQQREALETKFVTHLRWQAGHFPEPRRQHRFHPTRKWAFDFAWIDQMVAVEIDGGLHQHGADGQQGGRHQRPGGYIGDCDKLNEAALAGWVVLRITDSHLEDGQAMRWLERALNPSRRP